MLDKNEKTLDFNKTLNNIQNKINEIYPFNILLKVNPEKPHNAFIITISQKAFKKYGKDVLNEIFKYFKEEFKVNADLVYEKRKKPLFDPNIYIYYSIKIN